jgi:hypothetical protein
MDYWIPKHVELTSAMNKINHQISPILLDYIYIAKWYKVHTVSNSSFMFVGNHYLPNAHDMLMCRLTAQWTLNGYVRVWAAWLFPHSLYSAGLHFPKQDDIYKRYF